MRYTPILVILCVIMVLSSCVDTKPFEVGGNIDAEYDIVNMNNLEPTLKSVAKRICLDNLSGKMAVGYFIDRLNYNRIDAEGRYIAKDLADMIRSRCGMPLEVIDPEKNVSFEEEKTVVKPVAGFRYFLLGTYRYSNKGYNMFIRIVDMHTGTVVDSIARRICNRRLEFSIEPLHIPQKVIIPIPWRK